MMMQHTHRDAFVILPPTYTDDLTRVIGTLQQLQLLMVSSWHNPTLADVAHLVLSVEQDFGSSTSLEQAIQTLIGQHLTAQKAQRLERQAQQEVTI
jgi:DTW domain-containing protein YfiP